MREALPFQQGTWHTRVDWDGRTRWEKSGEKLSPIMQRWLVAAPGVTARPPPLDPPPC